ncbi:MAG: hypothetical protein UV58_C0011G0020 [Candidatus Wolfebacteria bacterium GW2011_GWC1_43_10]|uniref:Aminopeptidase n=1 Tax=Candidatus Wolfebacteria bacterium GW2011_GWC1_43_10 TaxID=1619011 RepID=A0A0G1EGU9_9BACT|nr:MAG: hypothetical protein UV58_C0011G0020 [Candidatus Wolfebacteria bacterium GW2011_GWC1_43_10]
MLTKTELSKYADVLIWGLQVARSSAGGKYRLLKKGFHIVMRLRNTPKMDFDFFNIADEDQLKFMAPWNKKMHGYLNGMISLSAPSSLTHLKDIDPKRITIPTKAYKPLRKILDRREQEGKFGWTLCLLPTKALAHHAKMPSKQYSGEIVRACYLNKPNPVAIWKNLNKKATAIKKWLNNLDIKYLKIESKNINLKIKHGEKRRWLGVSGHNIPSFEIFTSPDWREAEGTYYANIPGFRSGNYAEGIKLSFKNGRVVKATAKKGERFLKKQITMDKGASQIGEISFTDKRFSPIRKFMASTLYDENMGGKYGNCHMALGASYANAYKGNQRNLNKKLKKRLGFNDSTLHWDLINTENKKVTAYLKSGKKVVIYKNGTFTK